MNWLRALIRRRPPVLSEAQAATLQGYCLLPRPDAEAVLHAQRAVVVDVESSGLDPLRDRLISIGAVGVRAGLAHGDDAFEVVLRQESPSAEANILVHGIGGEAQLAGREPVGALLDLLSFAGKAPLVAFHADFDRILIERATTAALGIKPDNAWLDLAVLAPALLGRRGSAAVTLDGWLQRYGIEHPARHDALADAFATAQLLLVVLDAARKRGMATWAQLARLQQDQRWLRRVRRY